MKVKELIKKLQKEDQEAEVIYEEDYDERIIHKVTGVTHNTIYCKNGKSKTQVILEMT